MTTSTPIEHEQSPHVTHEPAARITSIDGVGHVVKRLRDRLRAQVLGRDHVVDLIIVALLSDGHVLLEDYPGSGKTTLAKGLGDCLVDDLPTDQIVSFRRIQFTPDLLPSDITGTTIFEPQSGRFFFRPGPIMAHIVLADEINRTSPKVQAALLEAMAEKQTTVDNKTRKLDDLFLVIATQNPLDVAGTFPLPAAQLDRFLFKIRMTHIDREAELQVLTGLKARKQNNFEHLPRVTRTEILDARQVISDTIYVAPAINEALVDLAQRTRTDPRILQGASTRSLVLAVPALQVRAAMSSRSFVSSEDITGLAVHLFGHRLELAPGYEEVAPVIQDCCKDPIERLSRHSLERR